VGDDGIMAVAITRLAATVWMGALLVLLLGRRGVFFAVCAVVLVACSGLGWVVLSLCVGCGRTWHRRALGFHSRQSGDQRSFSTGISGGRRPLKTCEGNETPGML
jgi:hypothetical protein